MHLNFTFWTLLCYLWSTLNFAYLTSRIRHKVSSFHVSRISLARPERGTTQYPIYPNPHAEKKKEKLADNLLLLMVPVHL